MKAYPLIFSRTKNEDFVPDFLARPADLDVKETQKYVHDAMQGLDTLNSIRYTTFAVGNYCICGGIACISKQLVQKAGVLMETVSEYLKDCKGRSLACFIGFAIPFSETKNNVIPEITLETYWNTYLTFLKHQWDAMDTESEKLKEPEIELSEKKYDSSFKPTIEVIGGKAVIRHFEDNSQQILDYYFNELLNQHNTETSFISDILYKEEWDRLYFKNASVSENLYTTLKTAPVQNQSARISSNRPNIQRNQFNAEVKSVQPRSVAPKSPEPKAANYGSYEGDSKKKQLLQSFLIWWQPQWWCWSLSC